MAVRTPTLRKTHPIGFRGRCDATTAPTVAYALKATTKESPWRSALRPPSIVSASPSPIPAAENVHSTQAATADGRTFTPSPLLLDVCSLCIVAPRAQEL
jgi:hypothetical protein